MPDTVAHRNTLFRLRRFMTPNAPHNRLRITGRRCAKRDGYPTAQLRPPPAPTCRRTSKAEFDAFLECGILAHGFLRLRCGDCSHDTLVAFSCKRRGLQPVVRRPAHGAWRRRRRTWWIM